MLNVNWTGESGQVYTFATYEIGTQFHPIPGVYVFCKPTGSVSWAAQYVGETESFADRLNACDANHHAMSRARRFGATHVGVLRHGSFAARVYRLDVERDLRRGLRPPANDQ